MCYSRPVVYAYVPNFVSINLLCRPLAAKNAKFCRFLDFENFVVSLVGGGNLRKLNTLHNYKPSTIQRIKIVSVLERLQGEIGRTIADVQKRDEQTDRQTDRHTKTQRFWPRRRRVKSEPYQTLHGDRGPRSRSCISRTFGDTTHSFAARGR